MGYVADFYWSLGDENLLDLETLRSGGMLYYIASLLKHKRGAGERSLTSKMASILSILGPTVTYDPALPAHASPLPQCF